MVYIPYLLFARFHRNKSPEITDKEIYALWSQLLDYHIKGKLEFLALEREYGALLRFNRTNYTPKGRTPRPTRKPR